MLRFDFYAQTHYSIMYNSYLKMRRKIDLITVEVGISLAYLHHVALSLGYFAYQREFLQVSYPMSLMKGSGTQ